MTPPVLDVDAFEKVLPRLTETGLPIVAGVAALGGVRQAEFLASEVVGVRVAEALLKRLREAGDEAGEAMAVTLEIARWLRDRVQGLQITTLHGSVATAEALLRDLAPVVARSGSAKA